MIKHFNINTFVRAMAFFLLLIIISYIYAFALNEGNSLSLIEKVVASLFYVFGYPSILLLYVFDGLPLYLVILGLLVNSAIYAFLTERVIYLLFRKKRLG
jgi:hypothetical protein